MGRYCEMCGQKDKDLSQKIYEVHIDNYVDGKWYSAHAADLCENCRETIFCCQDRIKSVFNPISKLARNCP